MQQKPTTAFVLALIGGVFILLGGLLVLAIGAFLAVFGFGFSLVFGVIGMASGILVILGAVMMYVQPRQHVAWGIIVLVFSILSVLGALAGFVVGLVLGIIGGALGIGWKPEAAVPAYAPGYPAYGPLPAYPPAPGYAPPPGATTPGMPAAAATAQIGLAAPIPPAAPPWPAAQAGEPTMVRCGTCGTMNRQGGMFCTNCGTKLA